MADCGDGLGNRRSKRHSHLGHRARGAITGPDWDRWMLGLGRLGSRQHKSCRERGEVKEKARVSMVFLACPRRSRTCLTYVGRQVRALCWEKAAKVTTTNDSATLVNSASSAPHTVQCNYPVISRRSITGWRAFTGVFTLFRSDI